MHHGYTIEDLMLMVERYLTKIPNGSAQLTDKQISDGVMAALQNASGVNDDDGGDA
jgi:hypothetical protein